MSLESSRQFFWLPARRRLDQRRDGVALKAGSDSARQCAAIRRAYPLGFGRPVHLWLEIDLVKARRTRVQRLSR